MSATDQPDDFAAVRSILAECRRQAEPFPAAWSRALERLPPAEGRTAEAVERRSTREALQATREAWEAGYHRRPLPGGVELAAEQVNARGTPGVCWPRRGA